MSGNPTNLEIDSRANLTIIAKNSAPIRDEHYPDTWMVNSGGKSSKVRIARDCASHPFVEGRSAA